MHSKSSFTSRPASTPWLYTSPGCWLTGCYLTTCWSAHTHIHKHTHKHTHIHTYTHIHTHAHTHTDTHMHMHTHTYKRMLFVAKNVQIMATLLLFVTTMFVLVELADF